MPAVRVMLTLTEREEISRGLAEGLLYKEIGVLVGRDPSIVSREVARHGGRARPPGGGRRHRSGGSAGAAEAARGRAIAAAAAGGDRSAALGLVTCLDRGSVAGSGPGRSGLPGVTRNDL